MTAATPPARLAALCFSSLALGQVCDRLRASGAWAPVDGGPARGHVAGSPGAGAAAAGGGGPVELEYRLYKKEHPPNLMHWLCLPLDGGGERQHGCYTLLVPAGTGASAAAVSGTSTTATRPATGPEEAADRELHALRQRGVLVQVDVQPFLLNSLHTAAWTLRQSVSATGLAFMHRSPQGPTLHLQVVSGVHGKVLLLLFARPRSGERATVAGAGGGGSEGHGATFGRMLQGMGIAIGKFYHFPTPGKGQMAAAGRDADPGEGPFPLLPGDGKECVYRIIQLLREV